MRVARGVIFVGMAVLLLSNGCSGGKGAFKELADSDPTIRSNAVLKVGESKSKEAVDPLIGMLNDPDESVRVNVIRALSDIGDRKAVPALIPMAADRLSTVRMAAFQALGALGDPRAVAALERGLYDDDETLRVVAARSLGIVPGPESLDVLIRVALQDQSDRVRGHVVKVVGERRVREAVPKLESALAAESEFVRANAASVLGEVADRSSVPVLVRSLDDPFWKVRCLASHSIAKIAPDDADARAAIVTRLQTETTPMARVDLAWSAAAMGDRSQLEVVRSLLFKGEPEDVRAEAAIALGELGDRSDLRVLERAMSDRKGMVRARVADAIDKIKGVKSS